MTTLPEEAVKAAARELCRFGTSFSTIEATKSWVDEKWPRFKEEATRALTAAAPHLASVRVKTLEWREDICRKSFISDIGAVSYSVFWDDDAEWCDIPEPYDLIRGEDDGDTLGSFETADEAKAAAQADYSARILSALEPSAPDIGQPITAPSAARELALEEHLHAIEQQLAVNLGYFHDEKRFLLETLQAHITTRIAAIRVLSSPDHADAGKVEEVKLPAERVCIPDPHNLGARIVGFRIREGDDAWGETGLSEPISWLNKLLAPDAGKVEGDGCKWQMREIVAKAIAYHSVGDPHAKTIRGDQRWEWFVEEADKFISVFGYYLPAIPSAPASEGAE